MNWNLANCNQQTVWYQFKSFKKQFIIKWEIKVLELNDRESSQKSFERISNNEIAESTQSKTHVNMTT